MVAETLSADHEMERDQKSMECVAHGALMVIPHPRNCQINHLAEEIIGKLTVSMSDYSNSLCNSSCK